MGTATQMVQAGPVPSYRMEWLGLFGALAVYTSAITATLLSAPSTLSQPSRCWSSCLTRSSEMFSIVEPMISMALYSSSVRMGFGDSSFWLTCSRNSAVSFTLVVEASILGVFNLYCLNTLSICETNSMAFFQKGMLGSTQPFTIGSGGPPEPHSAPIGCLAYRMASCFSSAHEASAVLRFFFSHCGVSIK